MNEKTEHTYTVTVPKNAAYSGLYFGRNSLQENAAKWRLADGKIWKRQLYLLRLFVSPSITFCS